MAKDQPLGVRLEDAERAALKMAAAAEARAVSAMARKIIGDWLKERGWLKS